MAIPDGVELDTILNTTPGKSGTVPSGELYHIVDKNSPQNVYMHLEIRTDRGPQIHRGPLFGGSNEEPGLSEIIALGESVKSLSDETLLREFIREALLSEAFTKTDEKAIEVMARKQRVAYLNWSSA